jgi:hypothetical protein
VVLRGIGFACALALGVAGVWLIATGSSVKTLRIGALTGFWGLLIGALSVFGTRHAHPAPVEQAPQQPGHELEVRRDAELVRAEEAAARRHFEARLEHMLRHEIQAAMNREVASLRSEVTALRTELLEKVGGQLRLERIETTRVIGSDIEALQREVDQLKSTREQARPQMPPQLAHSRVVDLTPPPAAAPAPAPQPAAPQQPVAAAAEQQPVQPQPVAQQPVRQQPAEQPPVQPQPVAQQPVQAQAVDQQPAEPVLLHDDFAGLPRLRPFTDFELDPIEPGDDYSGRRRAGESTPRRARHGSDVGRRREGEDGHDVLARILQRETAR